MASSLTIAGVDAGYGSIRVLNGVSLNVTAGQTVALLRPKALLWKQMQANGSWAVRFPAGTGVVFCFVAAGHCQLEIAGEAPRRLEEGDFLLLLRPPRWRLGRDKGGARQTIAVDYVPTHDASERSNFIGDMRRPAEVKIVGGRFAFDPTNVDLLNSLVPRRVEVLAADELARRRKKIRLDAKKAVGLFWGPPQKTPKWQPALFCQTDSDRSASWSSTPPCPLCCLLQLL